MACLGTKVVLLCKVVPKGRVELPRALCPTVFETAASTIPPLRHVDYLATKLPVERLFVSVDIVSLQTILLTRLLDRSLQVSHGLLLRAGGRARIHVQHRHHRRESESLLDHLRVGHCLEQKRDM